MISFDHVLIAIHTNMKNHLKFSLKLFITFGLLYYIFTFVQWDNVLKSLSLINIKTLILAFILYFIGSISVSSLITISAFKLPLSSLLKFDRINIVLRSCAFLMPAYIVSAIRWKVYNLIGFSASSALRMMLLNRFQQLLISSTLVAILVTDEIITKFISTQWIPYIDTILYLVTGCCLCIVGFSCNVGNCSPLIFNKLKRALSSSLKTKLEKAFTSIPPINIPRFIFVLLCSLLSVLIIVASQQLILSSYINIDFNHLIIARSFVQILLVLPITVAGLGVREAGFVGVLSLFGYKANDIIAFTFVLLGFQVILFLIGLFLYLYDKKFETFGIADLNRS